MSNVYSEKVMMRISVWLELLTKACNYLVVCEKYYQKLLCLEGALVGGSYYVGDRKNTYSDYWTIEKGLSEAAVVAISNAIFTTGNGDVHIADNKKDEEIIEIRNELLQRSSKKLCYVDNEEFDKYCEKIKCLRDQIIAHYDAKAADYENMGVVITRKMASAAFLPDEITKLKNFAFALLETLRQILTEQESC